MDNQSQIRMVSFAARVLDILATHEDWGADTLELIAASAHNHGLAKLNGDGLFTRGGLFAREEGSTGDDPKTL